MEKWVDIKGFEGLYQVSNYGRVKSMEKWVKLNQYTKHYPEQIRKLHMGTNGYLMLMLSKNKKKYPKMVHRLVADAFIPNPSNLPQVNHKDEVKTNNYADNLEWCDRKYNCQYGTRNKRVGEKCSKKVFLYDLNNSLIKIYDSTVCAAKDLNITQAAVSYDCINECELKTKKGYKLSYRLL